MNEQHDEKLGVRLDELEVQEHGPGYWASVMAAAEPELERLRAGAAEDDAGLARPAGPDLAGGPQARQSDRRRLFGGRRWLWVPAAAAIAAAAALVLLFGLPGGGSSGNTPITFGGPQPASAAEAIRFALDALDKAQAIKGTIYIGKVHKGVFAAGDKVTFLSARDGSYRVTTRTVGPDALYPLPGYVQTTAYNARTRKAQAILDFGSKGISYENTTVDPATGADVTTVKVYRFTYFHWAHAAPAPPESVFIDGQSFPLWQVRAYLRTMLGDPRVKFATARIGGRKVWLLTTNEFSWGSHGQGSRGTPVTIAIDARTRLPLRISGYWGSGELRIDSAAYAAKPPASAFVLRRPPAGQTHDTSKDALGPPLAFPGLPFGSAAAMKTAVDGVAAFPGWVPRGFALQVGAHTIPSGSVQVPRRFGTRAAVHPQHDRLARVPARLRCGVHHRASRLKAEPHGVRRRARDEEASARRHIGPLHHDSVPAGPAGAPRAHCRCAPHRRLLLRVRRPHSRRSRVLAAPVGQEGPLGRDRGRRLDPGGDGPHRGVARALEPGERGMSSP